MTEKETALITARAPTLADVQARLEWYIDRFCDQIGVPIPKMEFEAMLIHSTLADLRRLTGRDRIAPKLPTTDEIIAAG